MALHQFYADFPVAEQIVSDRGTQFVNDMAKKYNKLCVLPTHHIVNICKVAELNSIEENLIDIN
jgi:hypothetical protein